MNNPCSMTPGIATSRAASAFGSAIRCSAPSRIQCPPSVTKAWPSLVRRSVAAAGEPAAAYTASIARRVDSRPNGSTSTGSGKRPSVGDPFQFIGDDDHARRRGRHDLLPQQCAAATLDEAEIGPDLVGAVDRQVKLRRLVQCRQRHADPLGIAPGRVGGWDTNDLQAGTDALAEQLHEMLRRGARAQAQPHARTDVFEGPSGRGTFLRFRIRFRIHGESRPALAFEVRRKARLSSVDPGSGIVHSYRFMARRLPFRVLPDSGVSL